METMQTTLQSWSFARVLLVSGAWISAWLLLGLVVVVSWFLFQSRSSGSAGVGAVSFGISEALLIAVLAALVVPPAALIVSWLVIRRP